MMLVYIGDIYTSLTLNKLYESLPIISSEYTSEYYYSVINDKGNIVIVRKYYFITLEKQREEKINIILNDSN